MRLSGGDDEIVGGILLQDAPHGLNVVAGKAPVAACVQVAEVELALKAETDSSHGASDFSGDKGFTAAGRLVIEEQAVGNEQGVGFAVVDAIPVRRDFGYGIRAAGVKRRRLTLWGSGGPEHFGRSRLVHFDDAAGVGAVVAQGFEE